MSYAADHLAWKQRVYKEQGIGRVNTYGSPLKENVKLPTHGIAELYAIEHSPSDPNLMGHYDVKRTLKTLIADPTKERLFSSPNRFIIDRYGRIIGNTTFQTTQKISFSPVTKNPKSLINFTNGVKSPSNKSNNKLFKSMSTMFQSPRKAKAKPFFEQAYMPKSHIDSMSQIESKIKHIQYSLTKLKPRNRESTGELPLLKKERFNENFIKIYN